jgi:type IV secretory pathway TraG/TraD family ATPase VirD4
MNTETILGSRPLWGGGEKHFSISHEDRRRHMYIIGSTGSGKTTLMKNCIIQHFLNGDGVSIADAHGEVAAELMEAVPNERRHQVIYFNPADTDYPISFNPLSGVKDEDKEFVASGIVSAFHAIWKDSWGPRMEYILYNSILSLLYAQNSTLLGLSRILIDERYRRWVVKQVRNPFVKKFWEEEFENYDDRFLREAISPIQNKVGQFLNNATMRNILGQVKNRVEFREIMDRGKIFIANLSKGKLEDKAHLLGSLITTSFQLAAMSRVDTPENKRRDHFYFVDEFQNFTSPVFASILSEARKYRLCLTLSHQYIDQITPDIRSAVFGNVGSIVSFRVGYDDAEVLKNQFGKVFSSEQFVSLDRFQVLAKLLVHGSPLEPFRAKTLAPMDKEKTNSETLIKQCRMRYSTPKAVVEDKIFKWLANQSWG